MRRRIPGHYVSVRLKASGGALPSEMLDGPWPDAESARRRMDEIRAERPEGREFSLVLVGDDGLTVTPEDTP